MAIIVRKFAVLEEMQDHLLGGITGGVNLTAGVYDLQGKTLIFTSPSSATVTFTKVGATAQTLYTMQEIKAQIEAAIAAVKVKFRKGCIVLVEATPTSGIAITGAGTANPILGLGAYTGKFYGAVVGTPPAYINHAVGPGGEIHLTTVE